MQFDKDDRRFWPRYEADEAAGFLGVSDETLCGWFCGAGETPPLFADRARSDASDLGLSFMELIEAHIAHRYLELGVSAERLRELRPFLLETIDPEYPFAAHWFVLRGADRLHKFSQKHPPDCAADAMVVFEQFEGVDYGAWRHLPELSEALWQIDYDPVAPRSLAYRFFPYGREVPIVIYPPCGSGRLTVEGHNLLAEIVAGQHSRGETIKFLAEDYRLSEEVVRRVVTSLSMT